MLIPVQNTPPNRSDLTSRHTSVLELLLRGKRGEHDPSKRDDKSGTSNPDEVPKVTMKRDPSLREWAEVGGLALRRVCTTINLSTRV